MNAELADWIRTRPPGVQALMRLFPPSSYVQAVRGRQLLIPAPGRLARVVGYYEDGQVMVMHEDDSRPALAQCPPDSLELVRYDDLLPEDIDAAIAEVG